jgi:cytoskeletal protein CcmA (bactofilin family)
VKYHGSEQGWDDLLAQTKTTPVPPAGFTIAQYVPPTPQQQAADLVKSKKPEEERESFLAPKKESFVTQKEEKTMSAFEERKPIEPRFEPKNNPTREDVINIGKSVFIKGELTGDEDLTIEGRVEGKIELKDHNLVIGPNGKINAEINAKNVTVIGSVVGNISATEVVNAITSCCVVCSISSMRAMSKPPRSRMSRAASAGTMPAAAIASAAAVSTSSHVS